MEKTTTKKSRVWMQGMVFLWKTVLWKTTRMLLAAEETPSCSSHRVFLCRLIQKCIKEQMAHSLYEQTEGEWKTRITVWTTFLFYWARNCFRFVFWAAKMQTEEKKEQYPTSLPMSINSSTHFIFVIIHIEILFLTWAFTPNWVSVCLLWSQLGPRA